MNRFTANTLVAAAAGVLMTPAMAAVTPSAHVMTESASFSVVAASQEEELSPAVALAVELLAELGVMADLLENCNSSNVEDTASRVEALVDIMEETLGKVDQVKEEDPLGMAQIDRSAYFKDKSDELMRRVEKAARRLRDVDYYGSSRLQESLKNLGA